VFEVLEKSRDRYIHQEAATIVQDRSSIQPSRTLDMAQQVRSVAGKFGGKGIGAVLGLAGIGYAGSQSFYSGEYAFRFDTRSLRFDIHSYKLAANAS